MRRAGVLLHPSSLPGPYGIGGIGPWARRFLVWLESAGQSVWQFLPLNPVGGIGSPYSSQSAFARSPLLLSIDDLVTDGWLTLKERPFPRGSAYQVDYEAVIEARTPALRLAADRVREQVDLGEWASERPWVETWGLFRALQQTHGPDWRGWPRNVRDRDADALLAAQARFRPEIERAMALQWLFDVQWSRLRVEALSRGIALWGDLPIFVSGDACDVWAHRELFRLDADGYPLSLSGVPPDAFSDIGQLWGHPLFDFDAHRRTGHAWWLDRLDAVLELTDAVRIDHFRGLEALWEVPAGAPDARGGRWIPSFREPLLDAIQERFHQVPLIAEDLGIITPPVVALRDRYHLPGMAILQFAFDGGQRPTSALNPYLPHNLRRNQVVYTGTHDNDTVEGWYASSSPAVQDHARRYLASSGRNLAWDMLRAAYRSVADTAIVPLQDILSLGGDARMNVPGRAEGNWSWRMGSEAMNLVLAQKLREEARLSGRTGLPSHATPVSSRGED